MTVQYPYTIQPYIYYTIRPVIDIAKGGQCKSPGTMFPFCESKLDSANFLNAKFTKPELLQPAYMEPAF